MLAHLAHQVPFLCRGFATVAAAAPVFVVFGASGGIGSEVCRRLSRQEGPLLVLADRDGQALERLGAEIGGRQQLSVVDPVDPTQVEDCLAEIVKQNGRLDGVVNCVGTLVTKSVLETSAEEFQETLNTNLLSSFNVLKSSVRAMLGSGKGGSIVFLSAAVAQIGIPERESISAAKGGIAAMARSAAATYASQGIRVNCVAPGITATPLAQAITSDEAMLKAITSRYPMHRIGQPEDVAAAVEFLLNPRNAFITGQHLGVDGGRSTLVTA